MPLMAPLPPPKKGKKQKNCCSTSSPAFGVVSILNFGHSNRSRVVCHCCFTLQFLDDIWCGTSFVCLFLSVPSLVSCLLGSLAHFLIMLFVFLLLSFKTSLFIYLFCLFVFTKAAPTAYEVSQARGLIGAVAAGLYQSHNNARSEPSRVCNLHHSLQQRWIPNPLSKARDQTCNPMVPSQIR